jgi:zinc protease
MRGSRTRDFQAIFNALESVGASLGFSAHTHTVGFQGRALAEDIPLLLDILAETLRQPTFPDSQIERLRAQLLAGLAIRAQDTGDMASLLFDRILFRDHPYARPEDGFPETVQRITREDIVAFHRKQYGPRGMVLVIVGAVEPEEILAQVQRVLGDWENADQISPPELPPLSPLKETIRKHHPIEGKSQTDIVMGVLGPKRRDETFMAASLGNSILGQFGLMGRIGDAVRERSGLAYYAYSSLSAGIGPGAWYISAGVNPANVDKAIAIVEEELRRFIEEGVSEEELRDSQTNFIGRLPLSLESNAGVAGALLNIERYDLGLDYYRRYPALVQAVTREEVLAAARRYIHPDALAIATAGS